MLFVAVVTATTVIILAALFSDSVTVLLHCEDLFRVLSQYELAFLVKRSKASQSLGSVLARYVSESFNTMLKLICLKL